MNNTVSDNVRSIERREWQLWLLALVLILILSTITIGTYFFLLDEAYQNKYLMAILICDIDHFKAINDSWGHQVGDEMLKAVAQVIKEATRGMDLVARWGRDACVEALAITTREGVSSATGRRPRGVRRIGERA